MRAAIVDQIVFQVSDSAYSDDTFDGDDIAEDLRYIIERLHLMRSMVLNVKRPYRYELESRSGDWGATIYKYAPDGTRAVVKTSHSFCHRENAENWADRKIIELQEKKVQC